MYRALIYISSYLSVKVFELNNELEICGIFKKIVHDLFKFSIFTDGEPCVIGSNIDGYIPIRFEPSSTLVITGKHITRTEQEASKDKDIP